MSEREPLRHPTYGALADLAQTMEATLARGEFVRMGHIGALAWFVEHYQVAAPADTIPRAWIVEQPDGAVLGLHDNRAEAEHHLTLAAPGSRIVPLVP
jgi:hypothetical protein